MRKKTRKIPGLDRLNLRFPVRGCAYKGGHARTALKLHHLKLAKKGRRGDVDIEMLERMLEAEFPVADSDVVIFEDKTNPVRTARLMGADAEGVEFRNILERSDYRNLSVFLENVYLYNRFDDLLGALNNSEKNKLFKNFLSNVVFEENTETEVFPEFCNFLVNCLQKQPLRSAVLKDPFPATCS